MNTLSAAPPRTPRVYLASPLGFSEATRGYYQDKLIPAVEKAGFEVIDPWSHGAPIEQALKITDPEARRQALAQANLQVAAGNAQSIRQADAVLAVLDGSDVDSGTASEVGFAAALNKPIEGFRADFRRSGETGPFTQARLGSVCREQ